MLHRRFTYLSLLVSGFLLAKGPAPVSRNIAPVAARPAVTVENVSSPTEPAPARFRAAPAIGILAENIGYGGLIDFSFSTGSPFFVGIETGFLHWNTEGVTSGQPKMTSIPILASFVYRFDLKRSSVHPYIGAALGVSLTRGSMEATAEDFDASSVETHFEALGRPGVEFDLSRTTSFFLEPQFGALNSQFIFLPQIGLAFNF